MEKNEQLQRLGQYIRSKRTELGLTQQELASRSGVAANYIAILERGERNPSYLSLLKVTKGLGVDLCEIMK